MSSLGQLFLNLLVQFYISSETIDLSLLLIISFNQTLSLIALIFKLSCELMILQNSQPSGSLKLLIIKSHQISLSFFDFKVHFLLNFLNSFNLISLTIVDFDHARFAFFFDGSFEFFNLSE